VDQQRLLPFERVNQGSDEGRFAEGLLRLFPCSETAADRRSVRTLRLMDFRPPSGDDRPPAA
jgi:hypothetical protein